MLQQSSRNLIKQKNDEGKELSGEELQEYIEDLELDIKAYEEDLTDNQKEKEKFKSDGWKPYLIKYINDKVESETDAKKR